jgi:predicted nucleotide-binding protein
MFTSKFFRSGIAFFLSCFVLASSVYASAAATKDPKRASAQHAVELTFLKSNSGARDKLKQFIVNNWFAMDEIAVKQGLMSAYTILDTGDDAGDWNLIVKVAYPNEKGYDGIQEEFNKIRQAHKTVLVEGKGLRDLGRIISSKKMFEDLPTTRSR